MNRFAKITDYMATDLITLAPETEINKAMTVLLDARISGAPVVDELAQLVGVLSKKDCLKAALNAAYYQEWGGLVADYMSTEIQTLDKQLDLLQAAEAFLTSQFRRFPVLGDGKLIGQVSRCDILRGLSEQWQ